MAQTTRVLFIGGQGRSGSTVIENALERVPGIVSVGEFRFLFSRGVGDNESCRCGRPFRECDYWREVLDVAFPDGFDRDRIQAAVDSVNRITKAPALLRPRLMTPALRRAARVYAAAFGAAYRAVAVVSGADAIVDSSKYPLHGLFLRTVPEIDLAAMLLVRDPRAVAHSWTRRKVRTEIHWEKREMRRHTVVRSALVWNVSTLLTAGLGVGPGEYRVQRYEDFVADPLEQVREIARFALRSEVAIGHSIFDAQETVPHTISGNPARVGGAPLKVRADEAWKQEMSGGKQLAVASITALPMRHYGYSPRVAKQPGS